MLKLFILILVSQAFTSNKGGHVDIPGQMFAEEQTFFIVYAQVGIWITSMYSIVFSQLTPYFSHYSHCTCMGKYN